MAGSTPEHKEIDDFKERSRPKHKEIYDFKERWLEPRMAAPPEFTFVGLGYLLY